MSGLSSFDLSAYLRRVGCPRPAAPTIEALESLHEAHVGAVPFENLDPLRGLPVRLDLPSLQAKLVGARRGGYCFEQNTLFQAALESLGFPVTTLAARVRAGATGLRPRTHMLLRVEGPDGPWLADVGFGGDGLVQPIRLADGAERRLGVAAHRLVREGDLWVLQGMDDSSAFVDLYAFTLEAHYPVDYEMANHFTSTWPASPFRNTLTAQRTFRSRRVILRDRDLVVQTSQGRTGEHILDPEHLLAVLAREFDLAFSPGTRFPRPDFGAPGPEPLRVG